MADGVEHARAMALPVAQGQRFEAMDVLRGLALLGIFAMNVMVFAMPMAAYSNPSVGPEHSGTNRVVFWVIHTVFDLKMMALFSMLFGAGVMIWDRKVSRRWASDGTGRARWLSRRGGELLHCCGCGHDISGVEGDRWDARCPECGGVQKEFRAPMLYGTGLWFRRMGWLLVFGMIHAWLIWYGDILVAYALCGMIVVWWLRRLSPVWLLVVAAGFFGVHLLMLGFQGLQALVVFGESDFAIKAQESMTAEQLAEAREQLQAFMAPTEAQYAEQLATLKGGWLEVHEHRAAMSLMMQTWAFGFYIFWRVTAMMLLGVALAKWGVLTGERSAGFYAKLAAVGYLLGLPIVMGGILFNEHHLFNIIWFAGLGMSFNAVGSVGVVLGHIGLVVWLVKRGVLRPVTTALARVGQMAFTNYLMQSVLASLIFYGFGLGLAGDFGRLGQQMVVWSVWAVQILWSIAWLSRFRFGPAEWLWRSLTYWRLQPMLRDRPLGSAQGAQAAG